MTGMGSLAGERTRKPLQKLACSSETRDDKDSLEVSTGGGEFKLCDVERTTEPCISLEVKNDMPEALEVVNEVFKTLSPYEKIQAENIDERDKMIFHIFGDSAQFVSGHAKRRKFKEKKVLPSPRKSKRLQANFSSGIYSCPLCFEKFEEVSDKTIDHFNNHI
eukprot:GFUD01128976.1.p1 GENE.GFUD01128976.1~~GFUD01128976.1.p1  ORF type:complete len:163 (+),score=22.66 GFUD01128976.1:89-577(+)